MKYTIDRGYKMEENLLVETIKERFSECVITKTKNKYDNIIISIKSELWKMVIPLLSENKNFQDFSFYLLNEDRYILIKTIRSNSIDKENIWIIDDFEILVDSIKEISKVKTERKNVFSKIVERFNEKNIFYSPVEFDSILSTKDGIYCFGDYFVIYKKGAFFDNDKNPHIFLTYQQLEKEIQRIIFEKMYE
jgi:hypothetical protein